MKSLRGEIDFMMMESQGQLRNTEATLHMNAVFAQIMQVNYKLLMIVFDETFSIHF